MTISDVIGQLLDKIDLLEKEVENLSNAQEQKEIKD